PAGRAKIDRQGKSRAARYSAGEKIMSGLLVSLAWCSLQVTLVALLAWLLCGLARRMSPSHAAALPATALAAVIVLTALAFVPWPRGWSYGPKLSWREKTIPNADKGTAPVEKG